MPTDDEELSSTPIFDIMKEEIGEGKQPDLKRIKGVVEFHINVRGEERVVYTFDLRSFPGKVLDGKSSAKPNAVVTIEDENFVKLVLGEIDPIQGFMMGKIKVRGDILMMQKLNTILKGVRQSLL